MKKPILSALLRRFGLLSTADWVYYQLQRFKNRKSNAAFVKNHPNFVLPPDYLMFESFQINYDKYYHDGKNTSKWLAGFFSKHTNLKGKKILDWGCGPGRVIRHFPEVLGNDCEFFGTDYNKQTIDWCSKNLSGISFNHNTLKATLAYPDNAFDIIYGISVLTHLSEQLHYDWYKELYRVLKPGGILFLSTQGDNFKIKLTPAELVKYNNHELIIRSQVKEGYRMFSAFHPTLFMQKLFHNAEILEHYVEPIPLSGDWIPQDVWIIRK